MRLLILTCNTGEGHNAASGAIEEIAIAHGATCEKVDSLSFLSKAVSRTVSAVHVKMYRSMTQVWQKGYDFFSLDTEAEKTTPGIVVRLLASGAIRLRKYLRENDFDGVLCAHPFSAVMLSKALEKQPMDIPAAFLATDYTCAPLVPDQNLPYCCVPHADVLDLFRAHHVKEETLRVTGIPVRDVFYNHGTKEAAREALGVEQDAINVVLMCGSMGCGPMEELARALSEILPENGLLTVCCGTNKKLLANLEKARLDKVRPLGFTRDVPLWMDSADLFITKPGGLSVTEAANHGTPLLLMNVVGGCETPNFNLFLKNGYAEGVEHCADAPSLAKELLADPERRAAMVKRQRADFKGDAALCVWRLFDPEA